MTERPALREVLRLLDQVIFFLKKSFNNVLTARVRLCCYCCFCIADDCPKRKCFNITQTT